MEGGVGERERKRRGKRERVEQHQQLLDDHLIEVDGGPGEDGQQVARWGEADPQQGVTAILGHAVHLPAATQAGQANWSFILERHFLSYAWRSWQLTFFVLESSNIHSGLGIGSLALCSFAQNRSY